LSRYLYFKFGSAVFLKLVKIGILYAYWAWQRRRVQVLVKLGHSQDHVTTL